MLMASLTGFSMDKIFRVGLPVPPSYGTLGLNGLPKAA